MQTQTKTAIVLTAESPRSGGDAWRPSRRKWSTELFQREACRIGDMLVQCAIASPKGDLTWFALEPVSNGQHAFNPVSYGVEDGSAGIGLFFAALFKQTKRSRYSEASLAAFAKVREALGNGTLAQREKAGALAKLACSTMRSSHWMNDAALADDAKRIAQLALLAGRAPGSRSHHHVTCVRGSDQLASGRFAMVEATLARSQETASLALFAEACEAASGLLRRARRRGFYRLSAESGSALNPGLFHGLAGVGYQFLRLTDPATFPSVLRGD